MSKRTGNGGTVSVHGPGVERDGIVNVHVGLSVAQNWACRGEVTVGTWYVREDGRVAFQVERQHDGTVVTTRAAEQEKRVAERVSL